MTMKLTREKVIREIDELADRCSLLGTRIERQEAIRSTDTLLDLRAEYDRNIDLLAFAKSYLCRNELDFREAELGVLQLRQSLADISTDLEVIERGAPA